MNGDKMTKIANLICVENSYSGDTGLILERPISRINLETIPNNYSFFASFCIIDISREIEKDDFLHLELFDENGNELLNGSKIEFPPFDKEGEPLDNMVAAITLSNIKFLSYGIHELRLSCSLCDPASTYFKSAKK